MRCDASLLSSLPPSSLRVPVRRRQHRNVLVTFGLAAARRRTFCSVRSIPCHLSASPPPFPCASCSCALPRRALRRRLAAAVAVGGEGEWSRAEASADHFSCLSSPLGSARAMRSAVWSSSLDTSVSTQVATLSRASVLWLRSDPIPSHCV